MQKNAFYEIWTLLSRKVLQEERADDCNKDQEKPFYVYSLGRSEDHNRKKKEWLLSID